MPEISRFFGFNMWQMNDSKTLVKMFTFTTFKEPMLSLLWQPHLCVTHKEHHYRYHLDKNLK